MNEVGNDNASFSQAALEHIDALYGYAMALTRNQTEAEDLVQETYLRAMRALGRLMPDSNLKGWLFVIMRNTWLNQIRHDKTGPRFVELAGEEEAHNLARDDVMSNPYLIYLSKLEREVIKEAIDRLPILYREIIVLRDIEGFSYQEIATTLDCPAGTVMSRLGRARFKLRKILAGWQNMKTAKVI